MGNRSFSGGVSSSIYVKLLSSRDSSSLSIQWGFQSQDAWPPMVPRVGFGWPSSVLAIRVDSTVGDLIFHWTLVFRTTLVSYQDPSRVEA